MNILLVEDEARVADFVSRGLEAEGWSVEVARDGESALEKLGPDTFDIVVLDIMLPGISGWEVCRTMRARRCLQPVLMLSALDSVDERVGGLRIGADDYLTKPFSFDELVARLEALVRRARGGAPVAPAHVLVAGLIALDNRAMIARVDGREIALTVTELRLLRHLMQNPDRVLARERILNAVWGVQADPLTNVVDVHVGRLRRRLGPEGRRIETVRGAGYRFRDG